MSSQLEPFPSSYPSISLFNHSQVSKTKFKALRAIKVSFLSAAISCTFINPRNFSSNDKLHCYHKTSLRTEDFGIARISSDIVNGR